ncbi:MAG: DUF547 domain-containing protein [Bacteroidota bacterium]
MKRILIITLLTVGTNSWTLAQDTDLFFSKSQAFFKGYVMDGMVSYASVKRRFSQIDHLKRIIESVDLSNADSQTKKAFYVNTYNLIVIYQVTKNYPMSKPLDQEGFFDKTKYNIAGEMLTLNELEVNKLLKVYKDPRLHFALACAAVSCPQLANYAYDPKNIDEELTKRTTASLNNPEFVKVDQGRNEVRLSKIFDWYEGDFKSVSSNHISFINKYRVNKIPGNFKVGYYEYDWNLNDLSSRL